MTNNFELHELYGIEQKYTHLTPEQFARKLGSIRVPKNWDELTDELDRKYDEQQEVQKEHERRQKEA